MEKLDVMDASGEAVSWIVRNQDILLGYAVNLVAAVVIIIIGGIAARMISGVLNNLMLGRNIDATVAQFLSVLIRHAIIAFTLIAALGRVGVQTASVIAVLGGCRSCCWTCPAGVIVKPCCWYSSRDVPSFQGW